MSATRCCEHCGAWLPPRAPGGLCPKCLLAQAVLAPANLEDLAADQATDSLASRHSPPPIPVRFGDYELLEKVAEGGMGVVYRARQLSLNRIVAVKMIQPGRVGSPEMVLRFRAEAEAAASLHHPNIVPIHETGECEGQHFFSMDYIEGQNLAEAVRDGPLPSVRTAQLVGKIAAAVHYAHQHQILHRDLKPSNVILDGAGEPQVTDFGLARRLGGDSTLTLTGQVFGSPRFMPPEQASGRPGAVGVHSDVYGLGAILYYLLTARPPFVGETVETTLAQVLEQDPVSPRLLNASIPRDLETICLKCLEKEPSRRYASAQAVADELGRFLEKKPILARPVSRPEKVWRWCRRKPALATALGAVVLVAVVGFVGSLSQWQRAKAGELLARQNAYAADMNNVQTALDRHDLGRAAELLDRYRPESSALSTRYSRAPTDLRGWEWRYFWKQSRSDEEFQLSQYDSPVTALDFAPDGRLVLRSQHGGVVVWDLPARKPVSEIPSAVPARALAVSPVGTLLAFTDANEDGTRVVRLWDYAAGRNVAVLPHPNIVPNLAFSPDGAVLAGLTYSSLVQLWQVGSQRLQTSLEFRRPSSSSPGVLRFAPDGRWLAITQRGSVLLWDWKSGQRCELPLASATDDATALAWSRDGQYLAAGCGSADAQILVWNLRNPNDLAANQALPAPFHLSGHRHRVTCLVFSPGGKTLASAGADQTVRVWDIQSRRELRCFQGHLHEVRTVAFSPDGKHLASGGNDGTVRVWDPAKPAHAAPYEVLPVPLQLGGCAFAPDGRSFIALDRRDGSVSVWDTATLREREKLPFLGTNSQQLARSPDGRTLAVSQGPKLRIWDLATRHVVTNLVVEGRAIDGLKFSGQRTLVAGVRLEKPTFPLALRLWNTADWREIPMPAETLKAPKWAAMTPDGRTLAAVFGQGSVAWWDRPSGQRQARFENRFTSNEAFAEFSPDSRILATSETKGVIILWDVAARREMARIRGNLRSVHALAFTPDGRRLLSSGGDATDVVRLLDLSSRRFVASLPGVMDNYLSVTISPDNTTLVAIGGNGTALFWRAPSWAEIAAAEKGQVAPLPTTEDNEGNEDRPVK